MDAFEVQERVRAVERDKARLGRIDWYDRNVLNWWKNLKDLFDDPVWEGDLDDYCAKWFGKSEAEMREFLGLSAGFKPLEVFPHGMGDVNFRHNQEEEEEKKKAMTPAEKQRAYRERKKKEERK